MSDQSSDQRTVHAVRYSLIAVVFIAIVGIAIYLFLMRESISEPIEEIDLPPIKSTNTANVSIPDFLFVDVTLEAGLDFVHENGAYGDRLLPETMGSGIAVLDFDADGMQDLLLINSKQWDWQRDDSTATQGTRLFRNRGNGKFEDATNLLPELDVYGMGAAVADFDGDADVDVFLTALGANVLLRNDGDAGFTDVSDLYGVLTADSSWSTCATFFDYDLDGDLDLFVCNYVHWSLSIDMNVNFTIAGIGKAYGPPTDFPGTQNRLYRNDNTTFTDVSDIAGIFVDNVATGSPSGKALAVLSADLNHDSYPDLFVANDTVRNFLFVNNQDGTFAERGIDIGVAFDTAGNATGAMGMDISSESNPPRMSVAIGNFANEMSSLYVKKGERTHFSDDAIISGIGAQSRKALTFGLVFADLDLDGHQEIISANGHVEPEINQVQSSQDYLQMPQIYWHCGSDCYPRYHLATQIGSFDRAIAGRALAYIDYDNDNDLDLIVSEVGGRTRLYRNDIESKLPSIKVTLRYQTPNVHALGSKVELISGNRTQVRFVMTTKSYLTSVELPVVFALPGDPTESKLRITWPNGRTTTHDLEPEAPLQMIDYIEH